MNRGLSLALSLIVLSQTAIAVPNYMVTVLNYGDPMDLVFGREIYANNVGQVVVQRTIADTSTSTPTRLGAATWKVVELADFSLSLNRVVLPTGPDYESVEPKGVRDNISPLDKQLEFFGNFRNPFSSATPLSAARWAGTFDSLTLTTVPSAVSTGRIDILGMDAQGALACNSSFENGGETLRGFHKVGIAGQFTALQDMGVGVALASAIASDGVIAGTAADPANASRRCSVLWTTPFSAPYAVCESFWTTSEPTDVAKVDSAYWVVGNGFSPSRFTYRVAPGKPTRTYAQIGTARINSSGYMVIDTKVIPDTNAGTPVEFSSVVSNPLDWNGFVPRTLTDISDNGQIFGYATTASAPNRPRSFVATPLLPNPHVLTVNLGLQGWLGTAANIPERKVAYDIIMGVVNVSSGVVPIGPGNSAQIPIINAGPCVVRLRLVSGPLGRPDGWLNRVVTADLSASSQSKSVSFTPGDANGNGEIDVLDYLSLTEHYEKNETQSGWNTLDSRNISPQMVDFDDDGEVSILDYIAFSTNYEKEGDKL